MHGPLASLRPGDLVGKRYMRLLTRQNTDVVEGSITRVAAHEYRLPALPP